MATIEYPYTQTDAPGFETIRETTAAREDATPSGPTNVLDRVTEILGYDLTLSADLMVEGYVELGAEMLDISETTLGAQAESLPSE